MTIKTESGFTYGHTITDDNKHLNFNEGSGELLAELEVGSYTLDAFKDEIAKAMNNATGGVGVYETTIDRSTRKITITADIAFDLLIASGTLLGSDVFALAGFTGADLTSLLTYEGNNASGSFFEPQFLLQKFVDFPDNVKTTQASVNESASGKVEVVSYGKVQFMMCNIAFQTNISQGVGSYIKNDPAGHTNLRSFLSYATTKAPIEFIYDIDTPIIFEDCLLESTKESKDGVDYKVKELYSKGFAEYFESGLLTFRQLV